MYSTFQGPDAHIFAGVPDIVVSGGEPITPPTSTRDITSPFTGYLDTTHTRNSVFSPDATFALETPSRSSLQRSKRTSDASMLSVQDGGNRSS